MLIETTNDGLVFSRLNNPLRDPDKVHPTELSFIIAKLTQLQHESLAKLTLMRHDSRARFSRRPTALACDRSGGCCVDAPVHKGRQLIVDRETSSGHRSKEDRHEVKVRIQ